MILYDEYAHRQSIAPGGHSAVTTGVTVWTPAAAYNSAMNSPRHFTRSAAVVVLAIAVAILVAACGGAKKPPAPSASGHSAQDNGPQDAYRFSACMRSHGVSNFQDPHVKQNGNQVQVTIRVDPQITDSPDFKSAQTACGHFLPGALNGPSATQQHAREAAILAFSKCMRRHGFPRFPDPTSEGQLTPAMLSRAGIDLQQPAIKPAAYACLPLTHGIITRADVNQAIANSSGGSTSSSAGG